MTRNIDAFLARRAVLAEAKAIDDTGPTFVRLRSGKYLEIRSDVPKTRADCPPLVDGKRICGHCRCKYNLLLVEGDDRPGRRVAGKPPASTLLPVWRQNPMPPTCALDVADAKAERGDTMTIEEVGKTMNLRPSRVHEMIATAKAKLKAAGIDLRALMIEES